jgi:Protein of unknown function (DUF1579)
MKLFVLSWLVLLGLTAVAQQPAQTAPAATAQPSGCSSPEASQLDFWVGQWELTWPGAKPGQVQHGTNNVRKLLDGCVVQENFDGGAAMPLRGMSLSMWNARTSKWQQTWVDNSGSYLDLVGEFSGGQMTLSREATNKAGKKIQQRMVFKDISRDQFNWVWESSQDGGKTWTVLWPIHYTRAR